jgi:MoaD family protein
MAKAMVFASLRQVVGAREIEFPAGTIGELLRQAAETYGEAFAKQVPHCTILVNGSGVTEPDTPITDADQIAILPPVSGG